jgi:hypothetical protein
MAAALRDYPYLWLSLGWLGACAIGVALSAAPRGMPMLAGLLSAPSALASIVFVPEYWQPVRLATVVAGPEDFLFSTASGAIAWVVAMVGRRPVRGDAALGAVLARWLRYMLLGSGLTMGLWLAGLRVMTATLVAMALVGLLIVRRRPDLTVVALRGGLTFPVLYGTALGISIGVWPHFASYWARANLSGLGLFGLPLEELAWASGFGAVWPLVVADVLDVRLRGDGGRPPAPFARRGPAAPLESPPVKVTRTRSGASGRP